VGWRTGRAKCLDGRVIQQSRLARRFAEFGVLPDPADVGPLNASASWSAATSKNKIQPAQQFGHRRQTIGAKRLLSEAACATSLSAISEATASGESTSTTVSAFPISASIRFHLAAIDQRLKAARRERRFEPIREGHVLA
jgi:hypothetical protein